MTFSCIYQWGPGMPYCGREGKPYTIVCVHEHIEDGGLCEDHDFLRNEAGTHCGLCSDSSQPHFCRVTNITNRKRALTRARNSME